MVDAALIHQCADPALTPAIVERFIAEAGSPDPLAVTVRSGDRVVLVPKPTTPDEALALIREHVGKTVVRVGITQYPAGFGISDPSELKPGLVDACNAVDEAFDDAIHAWRTGYFEGKAVFSEPDPGVVEVAIPTAHPTASEVDGHAERLSTDPAHSEAGDADPNKAGIRIDLSGVGAGSP